MPSIILGSENTMITMMDTLPVCLEVSIAGMSNLWLPAHMHIRIGVNATKHKTINLLKMS